MGSISGPGYSGPAAVSYLFVDGGALRHYVDGISKTYFAGAPLVIDLSSVAPQFTKVFYYDAVPGRKDGESETDYEQRTGDQRRQLDAIAMTDKVHVSEGDVRRNNKKRGGEQKMVDVMLAVDLLSHTFRRNMHSATLLTGDLDFKPLVDAVVREGMFLTLWYPYGETSEDLMEAADIRRALLLGELPGFLSSQSKSILTLPDVTNFDPNIEPGVLAGTWSEGPVEFGLYRDGSDFVVTKTGNALNRLHVRHSNFALVKRRAEEVGIHIPLNLIDPSTAPHPAI